MINYTFNHKYIQLFKMGNSNTLSERLLINIPIISTSLSGEMVNREATYHELRILNKKFTKIERRMIRYSYPFYISIRLLNDIDDLLDRLVRFMLDDKFICHLSDAWIRVLIQESGRLIDNNMELQKLLQCNISFMPKCPGVALITDQDDIKAILKISSYTKNASYNIISDIYQLQAYITNHDHSPKHYIIARYDVDHQRLYFLLLESRDVLSIIENINDEHESTLITYLADQ